MIQFYITEIFKVPLPLLRMGEKSNIEIQLRFCSLYTLFNKVEKNFCRGLG